MRILVGALLSFVVAAGVDAQATAAAPALLRTGARVRVSAINDPSTLRVGTVAWVSADTLEVRLAEGDTVVSLAYREIAQLDVSAGRRRHTLEGASIGLVIGVAAGVISGYVAGDDPPGWVSFSAEDKATIGGAVLGGAGLIVGTIVGSNHVNETWQPIRIVPRASVSPRPSFGVRVSLLLR